MRLFLVLSLLLFSWTSPTFAADDKSPSLDVLCAHSYSVGSKDIPPADYVPNVDVEGNPLVPVEVESLQPSFLNNPIIVPIEIELIERFGLDLPVGTDLEPIVGQFEISRDGTTRYNGKVINNTVKQICDQHRNNKLNQAEQDGHESHVPVLLDMQQDEEKDRIEGQFPSEFSSPP